MLRDELESLESLAPSSFALQRKGTPGLVADILRARIMAGELTAGMRLPVERMSKLMGVSANAMREALQLLERERLVTQHLNRGIFVSKLGAQDIADVYKLRRLLEIGVIRSATSVPQDVLDSMRRAVELGEKALAENDGAKAGKATTEFHRALVSIADSERATVTMSQLMAELGLLMTSLHGFPELHEKFVPQRRRIFEQIQAADFRGAEKSLSKYLDEGERVLIALLDEN